MTPEQLQYDAMAMSDERNPNKLGGVAKVGANIAGFMTDPTTYASGGLGSLATKGAMKLGMNTAAKFGTQQASRIMAMGATRMMPRIVGGAVNFAAFEGLGTLSGQMGSGQDLNLGEIGFSTLKGAGMGALMPLASSWKICKHNRRKNRQVCIRLHGPYSCVCRWQRCTAMGNRPKL